MKTIRASNVKSDRSHPTVTKSQEEERYLEGTYYCDVSNKAIRNAAEPFLRYKEDTKKQVHHLFLFVRDTIIFGGDRWKVKASETLTKGYGACYNKNLLLSALLRHCGIPAKLCASPMRKDFSKAAMGMAYMTVSTPFYHCFTKVLIDGDWIDIDPTLDQNTYKTFFAPRGVDWGIDWDGFNDMLLYKGSAIGVPEVYEDIDRSLENNLNSHFLFRHEPEFLLSAWLSLGNSKIWKRARNNTNVHFQK